MATNKRVTDLTDYKSVLPYASELFGVYQPLIGWKSKRLIHRMNKGIYSDNQSKFKSVLDRYKGIVTTTFDGCYIGLGEYRVGVESVDIPRPQSDSILLSSIAKILDERNRRPENEGWSEFINPDLLQRLLNEDVYNFYTQSYRERCNYLTQINRGEETVNLQAEIVQALRTESAIAAALLGYVQNRLFDKIDTAFYLS